MQRVYAAPSRSASTSALFNSANETCSEGWFEYGGFSLKLRRTRRGLRRGLQGRPQAGILWHPKHPSGGLRSKTACLQLTLEVHWTFLVNL
jgi:hypothetical protein